MFSSKQAHEFVLFRNFTLTLIILMLSILTVYFNSFFKNKAKIQQVNKIIINAKAWFLRNRQTDKQIKTKTQNMFYSIIAINGN